MEDNMYPTSSEKLFKAPQKQQDRQYKAKLDYQTEKRYLHEILQYLRDKREEYASVAAIEHTDDVEKFMIDIRTNQKMVELLDNEINYIGGLVKKYDKE